VSTPLLSNVWTRLSAPFMGGSFRESVARRNLREGRGVWQPFRVDMSGRIPFRCD
jgi:hypothetical protein